MHFWIDKRAQSCGFGRARVAASLSGNGIGFGHHPRRIGGKTMMAPIHRYPPVEYRSSSSTYRNQQHHPTSSSSHATTLNNSTHSNTAQRSTTSSLSRQQYQRQRHQQHLRSLQRTPTVGGGGSNGGSGPTESQRFQQFRNILFQRASSNAPTSATTSASTTTATTSLIENSNSPVTNVQSSAGIRYQSSPYRTIGYGGHNHTIDLEQGSLGIDPVSNASRSATALRSVDYAMREDVATRPAVSDGGGGAAVVLPMPAAAVTAAAVAAVDAQLLPAHLKCGMWASLALATVFVAEFIVFQGTGLEVLLFGIFSTLFLIGACTVSLCRRPSRDLMIMAAPMASTSTTDAARQPESSSGDIGVGSRLQAHGLDAAYNMMSPQEQQAHDAAQMAQLNSSASRNTAATSTSSSSSLLVAAAAAMAPPPPYHIAILLPETSADEKADDSPPPSYDKLMA